MDPPTIIKFLELCACSVRIEVSCPQNRTRAAIATQNNSTVQTQDKHDIDFKLVVAVCGTGGLVAPLPCIWIILWLVSYVVWLYLAIASIGLV